MAKIITKDLKERILNNIKKKVAEVYLSGGVMEELLRLRKRAVNSVKDYICEMYPQSDMAVLRKYGEDRVMRHSIRAKISTSKQVVTDYAATVQGLDLYNLGIFTPDEFSGYLMPKGCSDAAIINNAAKRNDCIAEFIMALDRAECEIRSIVSAYSDRIKVKRSLDRLLTEYPDMKEFMVGLDSDGEKLIEQFKTMKEQ